jgi:hypothetical protein
MLAVTRLMRCSLLDHHCIAEESGARQGCGEGSIEGVQFLSVVVRYIHAIRRAFI